MLPVNMAFGGGVGRVVVGMADGRVGDAGGVDRTTPGLRPQATTRNPTSMRVVGNRFMIRMISERRNRASGRP
jgi:hypothetical protein